MAEASSSPLKTLNLSYMEAKKREGENGKEEEKIEMMPFFSHSLPT